MWVYVWEIKLYPLPLTPTVLPLNLGGGVDVGDGGGKLTIKSYFSPQHA